MDKSISTSYHFEDRSVLKRYKKISLQIRLTIGLVVLAPLLASCNLPGEAEPPQPPEGLVFTAAAQTIVAEYTQSAVDSPSEPATSPETPVDAWEATSSPEPISTKTEEPTALPSPSETPTSTGTPTATDIPNTIVEDDFSNTSLWYIAKEDDYGFEYKDGGYRIYNNILNGAIWSVRYQVYQDIRIEVDAVRLDGPEDGYYGVVCRMKNDGSDYYALVIGNNGFFGILKMEEGEQEFLRTGQDSDEVINKDSDGRNRVRGTCTGNRLVLVVNERQLLEVYDDSFTNGDVGILVGNRLGGVGMDVLFDNFSLVWP